MVNTDFVIEKSIPLPESRFSKYSFIDKEMESGDSFLCTKQVRITINSLISRGTIKSKIKSVKEGDMVRIWKL